MNYVEPRQTKYRTRLRLNNVQMILSLELNSECVSCAVELFIDYKVYRIPLIVDDIVLQETVRG